MILNYFHPVVIFTSIVIIGVKTAVSELLVLIASCAISIDLSYCNT